MKNKLLKYLIALSLSLVVLGSCKTGPSPKNEAEYQTRTLNISAILFPDRLEKSPTMHFTLNILDIKNPDKAEFFNSLLYNGDNPDAYKENLIEEYRQMYLGESSAEGLSANWEYQEDLDIRMSGEQGMVITRNKYAFTGGAHGAPSRQYHVIDLGELKALSLNDLFRTPESAELLTLIKEELRRYAKLEADQPLSEGIFFEDEPTPSYDFFISQEGISFHWNPYELAPYSEGHIEITLPWKTVRPLLLHEGMEVLTKFGVYLFV
jgi:hypothetical protein